MHRFAMKCKLHGATVTRCELASMGSLEVDRNLMEVADPVLVISSAMLDDQQARSFQPEVVLLDDEHRPLE